MILPHSKILSVTGKVPKLGKVYLVGAGPGDPDLITIKAVNALHSADVVLTDRLVSEVILHRYVPASAEIVYVGKECSRGASTPQSLINELMAEYALQGKTVVRLKGGDVSIFSNILDELECLKNHDIPYEIVPGITAALGAAAYAGMPLTARGHATAVRLLTYYKSDVVTDEYWKELAKTLDTLVFYMSVATMDTVIEKLQQYGIDEEKMIAVIEQATTPLQNIHISSFANYAQNIKGKKFASPSLVVIGKTVQLHHQFKWLHNSESTEQYFKSVSTENNQTENFLKNAI